jgi:hypothetical protein
MTYPVVPRYWAQVEWNGQHFNTQATSKEMVAEWLTATIRDLYLMHGLTNSTWVTIRGEDPCVT